MQVSGRYSVDHDVLRAMIEHRHRALEEHQPGAIHAVLMGEDEATADEADPEHWSAVLDAGEPVRHRLVTHGHVSVSDGAQVTTLSPDMALLRPVAGDEWLSPPLGDLLEPRFLAIGYEIADPVEDEHLDRPCIGVTASLRPVPDPFDATTRYEFGDRSRLVFDLGTGLIVKWQSWFEGAELGNLSIDELSVDGTVADESFTVEVPPGVPVRTLEELRAEMATRRARSTPAMSSTDALGDHMPRGEPPADPVAAESEIRKAVEGLAEVSADGQDAVNVHGGEGLGAAVRDAAARQPLEVRFALDAVRFLRADEAAIAFRVEGPVSMNLEGRALLVDGRWLLERQTVTRLLRMAGATIPPPPVP